jgi:tRNA threonylcarbamoyladenosine biosynthesis protein TsaB
MQPRLLSIDTTSEFGSLALIEGSRAIEEVAMRSSEGFAHLLFPAAEALLGRHRLGWRDLEGFAVTSGPGAFTGVRIGLTAAKGLAEALGRRVAAVSTLQALAWFGSSPLRAVVMDARRGEVFGAVYDASLCLIHQEVVMKFEDWVETLPQEQFDLISGDFELPASLAAGHANLALANLVRAPRFLAGAAGRIAAGRFCAGRAVDPAMIEANYVRKSDAELFWKGL